MLKRGGGRCHLTSYACGGFRARSRSSQVGASSAFQAELARWLQEETGYSAIQGTKPQTLAFGLSDSPVGLASWILDRFHFWCDCDGNIENSFSKDELLTNIMIYWVTETIASSVRSYRLEMQSPSITTKDYVHVPVALGLFPKDIGGIPPREFAERTLNVQHWKEMPRGGHFTAWEEPELMFQDILGFFDELRDKNEHI